MRRAKSERPFKLDAIVILPDHLHTVMTLPEGDANYPLRWRRIKTIFTQSLSCKSDLHRRDGTGRTVWQRRFWEHTIRDTTDLARHIDYIHINPVKHGLAHTPAAWPFSSLHRYIRQGIVAPDWAATCDESKASFGERSNRPAD